MPAVTFRAKLFLLVGTAAFALIAVVAGSTISGLQQAQRLAIVQSRLVPKLELGPRLERDFDGLNQALLDAVSAQDSVALEETLKRRDALISAINHAGPALDAPAAVELRWAIQDYYAVARDVSARSIAGETGEALIADMRRMQARRARVVEALKGAAGLDRRKLDAAFAAIREANRNAERLRLVTGLAGMLLLIALSSVITRKLLELVRHLSEGFARFATGDFTTPIPVISDDEIGRITREANRMAESLRALAEQRARSEWVSAGLQELSDHIRGELEPAGLARRALAYLVQRAGACTGALYVSDSSGVLRLSSQYAAGGQVSGAGAPEFRPGEGLVGQAALDQELMILQEPPPGYLRVRSALGEGELAALIVLPLVRDGKTLAVVELGLLRACSDELRQFLSSAREALAVSFQAAGSQAVLRETNEQLRAQRAALTQRNVELESARRDLLHQAEELARVSSYKSQFLANMSHELRTPLNSMLLLSHLLSENEGGNLSAKQVAHCRTIHSAGQDLLRLINQVLDLARIEAGREEVSLEEVELHDLLAYVRKVFEPLSADKGVQLSVTGAEGLQGTMRTDRQRVQRILTNLLGNAIKFTDHGSVSLRVRAPLPGEALPTTLKSTKDLIVFEVKDTGIGIAEGMRERVFAPFEQVGPRGDKRRGGSGLGLAISRESALLLGGELDFTSVLGAGSTFLCYLPRDSGPAHEQGAIIRERPSLAPPESGNSQSVAGVIGERPPLLLIEDDATLAEQIVAIGRARELTVRVASSGEEGLRLARECQPRGIILDVKLPDIDGWTVMKRLRGDPVTRSIPVYFVSAIDAAERGLALGALGYLTKPANHDELSGAVRALLADNAASRRVLIVEDDEAQAEALVALLRAEGVEVQHVPNAAAALALLAQERYGCLIVDLGLPDMHGQRLLERLEDSAGPFPRILVHTGRALTAAQELSLQQHANAVVRKTASSSERLLQEVRTFLRQLDTPTQLAAPTAPTAARTEPPANALAGLKLLLAEDDMRTAYALSALLGNQGAEVLVVETGRDALQALAKDPAIDAVLMAVMMPEMDGCEAIQALRREPRLSALPVLALSAHGTAEERERCLSAGANDFLSKPVDQALLLAKLRALVEDAPASGQRRDAPATRASAGPSPEGPSS